MSSNDDDYKNKLSDFARIIKEGKKHKLEQRKKLVEEQKKEFAKKLHKKEFVIDSSGFLDDLIGAMSPQKEKPTLVVENPDEVSIPETQEEIEPVVENVEETPQPIEEVVEPEVTQPTEENLIEKTVKSITKVAENTNLMSTTPVPKVDPNFKAVQDKLKYLEQWVGKISAAGPGSGSYWLNDMGDTDKSSLYNATDGQVLTFSGATRKWYSADPTGGGGGPSTDQFARNQANTATDLAQSAYNYANTIVSDTQIDPWARNQSNSAYNQANTGTSLAQAAFNYANTIVSDTQIDPWARNQSNAAFLQANTPSYVANSASSYANGAFVQANAALSLAQASYNYANTITFTTDPSAGSYANVAFIKANAAFLQANTPPAIANSAASYANAAFIKANTAITTSGGSISGMLNVAYTPATTTGAALNLSAANTKGGTSYADVLQLTNTSAGVTSPNKFFRINNIGTLEIINSAYTSNPLALTDTGDLTVSGNVFSSGVKSGYSTGRPGFRVYGSGTTNNLSTTQNSTGALNNNNWAVDFNQGSFLNGTSGVFTAPVDGLYQVFLVCRNAGNAAYSQLAIVKNASGGNGSGGSVSVMIEFAGNSTMNHTGAGTILQLSAGDTLACKVLAGTINFDSNDNWSLAYIG